MSWTILENGDDAKSLCPPSMGFHPDGEGGGDIYNPPNPTAPPDQQETKFGGGSTAPPPTKGAASTLPTVTPPANTTPRGNGGDHRLTATGESKGGKMTVKKESG